jgi:hypothetical protein
MKYHVIPIINSPDDLQKELRKMVNNGGTLAWIAVVENCTYTLIYTTPEE